MSRPILPGATLGMLGGGQLGRMMAMAAARLGYRVHVYSPEEDSPATQVASSHTRAEFDDLEAVATFAKSVDVVGYEFENVPAETALAAARSAPVRPSESVLHATQNRLRERELLDRIGLPTAKHAKVTDSASLLEGLAEVGTPAVLKTASSGYDGKGQRRLDSLEDGPTAWEELGGVPCLLEAMVPFTRELSVVGARGLDGELAFYEPLENEHRNHILAITTNPVEASSERRNAAIELARATFEGLDLVGVACVELFELEGGEFLINEIAPRPHNSGHLTIDAHVTSQFEQQVRAICGLPLGSVERHAPAAVMVNLLGDLWAKGEPNWAAALRLPAVRLHLYGKSKALPARKMGHLTALGPDREAARERALDAYVALGGQREAVITSPSG